MVIDRESWHFKTFSFMAKISKRMLPFLDYKENYRASIDLCTYMRTILVTGPLVLALTVGMWAWAVYVFAVLPFTYNDFRLWRLLGFIFIGIPVICIVVGHVIFLICEIFRKRKERKDEAFAELTPSEAHAKAMEIQKPGFVSIAWSNAKGIKNRYCPVFELK